ncbi:MAG: hypothetical protein AAB263_20625 [Planctomycetota bacterium]
MSHAILSTTILSTLYRASADGIVVSAVSPVCDHCGITHSAFGWWPADDGAQVCDDCWRNADDRGMVGAQEPQLSR